MLVYAFDPVLTTKSDQALQLMRAMSERETSYISHQVVHEFFNVAFRKFEPKMTMEDAQLTADAIFGAFQMVLPSSL